MFSSRYAQRLVPGMGMMSSPCASTQASASCDGWQPLSRRSPRLGHEVEVALEVLALETWCAAVIVRREVFGLFELAGQEAAAQRAVRDEADAQFAHRGKNFSSGSRLQSEYSVCSAAMGWTACARRIVAGAASDSPR